MAELDRTFAALADPTRLSIVSLLRRRPLRSGDLAQALDMNPPAVSKHLRILRDAGLVQEESPADDLRARVYQLRREPFSELRDWLDELELFWSAQLAAFKAHAERKHARPKAGRK